jgi:feruloyl esterase
MQQCGGGPGPDTFDPVAALERWVEKGVAPEKIIASHVTRGLPERTRPLCPYPQMAVYKGNGEATDAANFTCRMPQ